MISVCIPTYNGADYLDDCLRSVFAQTYRDFEVLLVDDDSSDATREVAASFGEREPRLKVIRNESRRGLVGNWNRCVELAQGGWIKFVFQDDLLAPACLERMLTAAEATKSKFVCCKRDFLFEDGLPREIRAVYEESAQMIDEFFAQNNPMPARVFSDKAVLRFKDNLIGEPTTTLIHRRVFEECGLFEPDLIMCCDYQFWNRVGSKLGVTYLPEALATFRVHSKSTTSENTAFRNLRMTHLDWFIMLYRIDQDPKCRELKEAGRRHGPEAVEALCRAQALEAYRVLRTARRNRASNLERMEEEWKAVAKSYPRLSAMAIKGVLLSRLERLRDAVFFRRVENDKVGVADSN